MLGAGCVVFMFFKNKECDEGECEKDKYGNTLSGIVTMVSYIFFDSFTSNWQVSTLCQRNFEKTTVYFEFKAN